MENIAQDTHAWMWLIKAAAVVGILGLIVWDLIDIFKEKKVTNRQLFKLALKFVILIILTLALFVFYGPGKATQITPAEDDGHRKMVMEQPDPPTKVEIREEAKAKKDSYLKKMDEGPEAAQKESEEYIKKALERNK